MESDGVRELLDELDTTYAGLHTRKEDAFWAARMGLDQPVRSQAELDARDVELARFLREPAQLTRTRNALSLARTDEERLRLRGWIATFEAHVIENAAARALAEELAVDEGRLELARGEMPLGYVDPGSGFVRASSVKLGGMLRAEPSEELRRAAWNGLRSIERYVLDHGFVEIIKKRNRLGRMLGGEDYYDWKARRVEGMSKAAVFELLDELELRTREAARRAVGAARSRHGRERLTPWNLSYLVAGDVTHEADPYFPFQRAVERWGRSFAALGIRYAGAELVLDLLDRPGKFENGFMHGPVVAWRRGEQRIPARIQFTANAIPSMIGSGKNALQTLFHEGGHAAHFANIDMPSPCFGQEFAPTSAAFAETQSMLCDSLLDDADWCARYARDNAGDPLPWEIIERDIDARQPFAAWGTRAMLAVCYAEKAIYELPESELSGERLLATLRELERRLLLLDEGSPRPILSVPHLISGDFSAYYHAYVLAEMAVFQARSHFLHRDGHLVDNPRIGAELARVWWQPGNSVPFAELIERLTGKPLNAVHLAEHVNDAADERKRKAKEAVARLADVPERHERVALDATIRIVHGRESVAELVGDFGAFCEEFSRWVDAQRAPNP